MLATCSEYALAGVLDRRELLPGEDSDELQVDEVPVARVLPAGSQWCLGDGVQLLGYLPADGERRDDVGAVEADGAEVVGGYLFDLISSGLDGCDLDDERHEGLGAERDLVSPREFTLLEVLARHPVRLISWSAARAGLGVSVGR